MPNVADALRYTARDGIRHWCRPNAHSFRSVQASPAATTLFLLVAAGGCAALIWAVGRLARGLPLLRYEPHPPVSWGGIEVIVCILVFFVVPMQAAAWASGWIRSDAPSQQASVDESPQREPIDAPEARSEGAIDPAEVARRLLVSFLASIAAMAIAIMILLLRGSAWSELGLSLRCAPRDVAYGVVGFFVISIPVYGLTLLLNQLVQVPPEDQHAISYALFKRGDDAFLVFAAFLAACVAAPIVEEFFIRGVFQGWLERLQRRLRPVGELAAATPILWLPIVASSAVFALLHVGNSPIDPFPIFVLALGLGYLYQRTGRLLTCIVMHACLNVTSLLLVVL